MSNKVMNAVIYHGIGDVRVEERPIPECGPNDVIVRNVRAGICGSDVTAYKYGGENMYIFANHEFGHEMVGYIHEKGENVTDVEVGDRVFVEPAQAIENPYYANMAGAFSQYTKVINACVGKNLYKLPDGLSYDDAVLIEPLSVSTHAKNRADVKPHEKVLILGSGPIGLGVLSALVAQGNKKIAIVDQDKHRLEYAEKMGAHPILCSSNDLELMKDEMENFFGTMPNTNHRVNFGSDGTPEVFEHAVLDVDVVFDCVGISAYVDEFLLHAKQYSRLCTIAVHRGETPVRFHEIMSTQCALMGSRGYEPKDIEEVISFLAEKRSRADLMVSHRIPLADAKDAFAIAANPAESVKVTINMD